jgi:hypothetical protein
LKKATKEQKKVSAAGFGETAPEENIPVNTGTPLKGRRDE